MNREGLLYVIPAGQYGKEGILALLEQHREIKFVSLVGVDLAGNDTDEKIPISVFLPAMKASSTVPRSRLTVPPLSCPVLLRCRMLVSILKRIRA